MNLSGHRAQGLPDATVPQGVTKASGVHLMRRYRDNISRMRAYNNCDAMFAGKGGDEPVERPGRKRALSEQRIDKTILDFIR